MEISFYSFLFSIVISSIFIVLLYFFRKKVAFCNYYGLYTILALYIVTFIRMALPFEFTFTKSIEDFTIAPKVMEFLTPDLENIFVFRLTPLNLLVALWGLGSVIYIARVIIKYFRAVKALKKSTLPCDFEMQNRLDAVAKKCGIKHKVILKKTDCVLSPVTYGFLQSVILFPDRQFSNDDFDFIAMHECCHIKNKDIWIKLLTEIYCGIFWWNPFVHLLKKDLSFCLELRCDKRVTKTLNEFERCNYGQVLVAQMKQYCEISNTAKNEKDSLLKSALVGMSFVSGENSKKHITRMELILYPNKKQSMKNGIITALVIMLACTIFFGSYCFLIVPAWNPTYEECVADIVENGKDDDNVKVYEDSEMYVYIEKDKTCHLVFEPYDKKKGVVITDENSVIIPYSDIKDGYYDYCLILKEE